MPMPQVTKSAPAIIKRNSDASFVLASSNLDRDYDTIEPSALGRAASKNSNLLCLWQHKRDQPIGSWRNLKADGARLTGDLNLASTNMGQMVKQLLDEEVPLAASIGFYGDGEPNDFGGINFTDIELLECSVVSIPANPEAIRIAKGFGVDLASFAEGNNLAASGLAASKGAIERARSIIARVNLMRL